MTDIFTFLNESVAIDFFALGLLGALAAIILSRYRLRNYIDESTFADSLPALIWSEENTGKQLLWANRTFKELEARCPGARLLLSDFSQKDATRVGGAAKRVQLEIPDQETLHFDLTRHHYKGQPYYYALSAQASAKAEEDRERFVKGMSETFAHLPIGIAVFDKDQDLSMFNPALSDLLSLAPSWLASQPSLRSFLDRLHDKGDTPEPRDFKTWRDQILSLENSAEGRSYLDDWNLMNGRVYRITGQSYPRGSVALFVEDISNQVNIETEYRLEIRRLYHTFDALSDGIAVFTSAGELSFANAAFEEMWNIDAARSVLVPDIQMISKTWSDACEPTPVWGELRGFVSQLDQREAWTATILRKDGAWIDARFSPLVDGYTFCSFAYKQLSMAPALMSSRGDA